jgi:hypothetical protein
MLRLTKTLLSVGIILAATPGDPPQVLGLVATAETVPVHCDGTALTCWHSVYSRNVRSAAPSYFHRKATTDAV